MNRRTLLAAAAWSAPAVALATTAPAYATSTVTSCSVTGVRVRKPAAAKGRNRWSYAITVTCDDRVKAVTVNGKPARSVRSDLWIVDLPGKHDALPVAVTTRAGTTTHMAVIR